MRNRLLHLIACVAASSSSCLEKYPCPGLPDQLCCQEISWSLDAMTSAPGVYPASPIRKLFEFNYVNFIFAWLIQRGYVQTLQTHRLIPVDCPSGDNSDNNAVCGLVQVYMQRFGKTQPNQKKINVEKDSGIWSVICNPAGRNKKGVYEQLDVFTMNAATVACRQMGFERATAKFDYNLKVLLEKKQ